MSKQAILVTTVTVIVVAVGFILSYRKKKGKLPEGGKYEIIWWALAFAVMALIVFVPFN